MAGAAASVALITTHAWLLPHSRSRGLNSNVGSVQVVPVQFANYFVDFITARIRVNVDESIILDDICLEDFRETAEQVFEFLVGRSFRDVTHKQLLGRLSRSFRFGFFDLDLTTVQG